MKGFWFVFHESSAKILASGSPLTGREWIYVNGALISGKRSLRITSKHVFQFAGRSHEIVFYIPKILQGRMECSLYSDGKLSGKYRTFCKCRFGKINFFLFFLSMGSGLYFAFKYWDWSYWAILPITFLVILIASIWAIQDIVIERVETEK